MKKKLTKKWIKVEKKNDLKSTLESKIQNGEYCIKNREENG